MVIGKTLEGKSKVGVGVGGVGEEFQLCYLTALDSRQVAQHGSLCFLIYKMGLFCPPKLKMK